jgi:DNA-binding transcriptional LysR family regulator
MRNLNLDQLKALEIVSETGSFTTAAVRLNLSQSAVSLQIKELEQRFGVRLIDRLGKKAFATPAGQEVIEHARRIAQQSDAISAAMSRYREGKLGRIRLAAGQDMLAYRIPQVLRHLHDIHPSLELVVRPSITGEMAKMLMRNRIDIAILALPFNDPKLKILPFRQDPISAVFPPGAKGIPQEITPREFARHDYMLDGLSVMDRQTREWLRFGGIEPKPAMEISNSEAIRNIVAAGIGASVLPPEVIAAVARGEELIVRPLKPPIVRTSALAWRRDKPEDRAFQIVREAFLSMLGNMGGEEADAKKSRRLKAKKPARK